MCQLTLPIPAAPAAGFKKRLARLRRQKPRADLAPKNEIAGTDCLACLPLPEHTEEELRHRENADAGFSFWRRNLSFIQTLVNDDRLLLPIDFAPAQREYLADPHSGKEHEDHRRTTWFLKLPKESFNFLPSSSSSSCSGCSSKSCVFCVTAPPNINVISPSFFMMASDSRLTICQIQSGINFLQRVG
jgi:hypothetical protein